MRIQQDLSTVHSSTVPVTVDLTSNSPQKGTTKMRDRRRYLKTKAGQPSCFRGPAFTKDKVTALLRVYSDYAKYPDPARVKKTAELLGLTVKQVKCWFRNRRARERQQRKYMQYMELKDTLLQSFSPCVSSPESTDTRSTTSATPCDSNQICFEFPSMPRAFQSSPDSALSPSLPPSPPSHFDPIKPSYNLTWSPDAVDSCWQGHVPCVPLPFHCAVICGLPRYGNGYSAVPQFPTPPQSHRYLPQNCQ
ncbi:homeobox protein prophet of Pit-1-like isoform X2 [Ptychodera flava]|uniref:homeobox protein prophet of Pit-1-like isoform X2 n=1 Tax=Ptychodera flava TaxID=63121 RepID=UPI003969CF84